MRFLVWTLLIVCFYFQPSYAELARGGALLAEANPDDDQPIARNYNQCSLSEQNERVKLFNKCRDDFSSMNLPQQPRAEDLRPKYSCSSIEDNYIKQAGLGCLKHVFALPINAAKAMGNFISNDKRFLAVKRTCGTAPVRRISRPTTSDMPDGQKRVELLTTEERYTQEVNAWQICYDRAVTAYDADQAVDSALTEATLKQTLDYCFETVPHFQKFTNPRVFSRIRAGSRDDIAIKSCQLNAMATLNITCDSCIEVLSPHVENPVDSPTFLEVLKSLRKYNPRAFKCYTPKKMGELACAAVSTTLGVVAGGVATVKIARAVGRGVSNQIKARAAVLAARSSSVGTRRNVASLSRVSEAVTNNVNVGVVPEQRTLLMTGRLHPDFKAVVDEMNVQKRSKGYAEGAVEDAITEAAGQAEGMIIDVESE